MNPRLGLLLLVVLASSACGPRYARDVVLDNGTFRVVLRSEVRDGEPLERDFTHPTTIAPVRMAHILSRIDVRLLNEEGKPRRPAVRTEILFELADAVVSGLVRAESSQEIAVQAIRQERRLGLFTTDFLTSFVAYVRDENLYVHFSKVDWPIPKSPDEKVPEPWESSTSSSFRVVPGEAMVPVGDGGVAVEWRDPIFKSGSHLSITATGQVRRRTILLESAPEAEEEGRESGLPADLSPEVLRELADLEEARRAGEISEPDYQHRRRQLLR